MLTKVIINIIVMLAFIFILYKLQKKYVSFSKRVFISLGLGAIYGIVLQSIYGIDGEVLKNTLAWTNLVGNGYVRLLKMIVMPLIMVSITSAIINLKDNKSLNKISTNIIFVLIGTTAISAIIGIFMALTFKLDATNFNLGEKEIKRGEYLISKLEEVKSKPVTETLLEIIPTNPFLSMTGTEKTSTLSIVLFSVLVGIALLGIKEKKPKETEVFINMINSSHAVVMRLVTLILRLTPYGILSLIANVTATSNAKEILSLLKFVAASYVGLLLILIVHLIILLLKGLNPLTYLKKSLPVLSFAFTSRTSAGTIPLNVELQKDKLGVNEGIANLSASFGASIGQNGCAGLYPAMLAVMIAPTVGVNPLSLSFIIPLVVVVSITSFGVAGVGGGATYAAIIVLSSLNLPVALVGLLISIEPLIDMGRTAINVSGSIVSGIVTAKNTNELDVSIYNKPLSE
ncbi:MAG: cation:dicarboxylase symporter family transporter [Fusobacteriaceae bacterium]|nr:cation:dicarboxylase symporter family transporter [Fusobacteriaceae bacterium]MBN2838899.1 cation:dicarboxylase symporter family transporter [Fusobacteriaceae bacterium]